MEVKDGTQGRAPVGPRAGARLLEADGAAPRATGRYTRRDSHGRRLLALSDVASLSASALVALAVLGSGRVAPNGEALVLALPLWVLLNKLLGLYDHDANQIHKSTLNEFPAILHSVALGAGVIFLVGPPLTGIAVDRTQVVVFALAAVALLPAGRTLARSFVRRRYPPERALIVGSGSVARLVVRKLRAHPEYGVSVVGAVDVTADNRPHEADDYELLGDLERLRELSEELRVERVVIAFSSISHERLLDAIRVCKALNLKITVVPRLFEVIGSSVEIDQIEGMTMLGLRGLSRTRSTLMLKRAIDLAVSGVGLLLVAPLLVLIALAVKLSSPGPVFFSHERIGRGDRRFQLHKFRTMMEGADELKDDLLHLNEAAYPMFKIAEDPRVTRVGGFLRRTSLDELPQLFNVLRGEMSLVGPRPLVPHEDDHVIGWHRSRLDLTPGLTGPWQVMGRTSIPFEEMVKIDYLYVADWSLWNDIKLLVRTAPVVLRRSGV